MRLGSHLLCYCLFTHYACLQANSRGMGAAQREGDRSSTGDLERLYSLTGDLLRLAALPLHKPTRTSSCTLISECPVVLSWWR